MILVKARKSSRLVEKRVWVKHPKSGKPFQYEPKDIDIPFFPRDIPALSKVTYAKDFSQVPPAHVSVFNKKTMLDRGTRRTSKRSTPPTLRKKSREILI